MWYHAGFKVIAFFNYAIAFCKQCQRPQTERYLTLLEDPGVPVINHAVASHVTAQHCPDPQPLPSMSLEV